MSIHQFYRFSVWLPVVLPMTGVAAISVWGWPNSSGVDQAAGVLVLSLVYGGIPYAALAVWATWWIGGRSEREIRRLALAAPLLMCAAFALVAVLIAGPPHTIDGWIIGLFYILPLGYIYVGAVLLARRFAQLTP